MSGQQLVLDDELTIYRAGELKSLLLSAVDDATSELEVNLAGVTELDTAGLQVLMLAKSHAQRLGRQLRLVDHSPAVLEVFELLNVAAYFGDPLVVGGPDGS